MSAAQDFALALADGLAALGWPSEHAHAMLEAPCRAAHNGGGAGPVEGGGTLNRISLDRLESLFRAAEADLDDPAVGLRAGHRFRVNRHGKTGTIYAHARDLSDVIALNHRFQRLSIDMGDIREVQRDGRFFMEFAPYFPTATAEARARYRHCSGMLMGAYVTAYRWLNWGAGEELLGVGIPAPGEGGVRETAEGLFQCPVVFDVPVGHLEFSERAMTVPLTTADAEKRALAVARLDQLLEAGDRQQSFTAALHAAIRGALAGGASTLPVVAERLDLSESGLRRHLRDGGLQFRAELDRIRRALLAERIAAGDSFATVALALAYNDQAAFNRAVKRWYGVPPGQWTPDLPVLGQETEANP